jgi:ubiquinone/menaquinone biosynthesis C-methylase UbiE
MEKTAVEIEFEKYRKRGAYHWQNYFGNVFKIDSFLRGRYDLVINLLRKSGISSNSNVLEIGCGDGALTGLIYKKFKCNLNGTEPDEDGIRFCKEMFSKYNYKAEFSLVTGYSLPFPSNHFDFVILADVIEHLQQPDTMLVEMQRLLKQGGKAIITTPIRTMEFPEDKMHVHEFFPSELISLCKENFNGTVEAIYSHPLVWHERYSYGKKRTRSIIRLYCRFIDKFLGKNVFSLNDKTSAWKNFKQQGLVLTKN